MSRHGRARITVERPSVRSLIKPDLKPGTRSLSSPELIAFAWLGRSAQAESGKRDDKFPAEGRGRVTRKLKTLRDRRVARRAQIHRSLCTKMQKKKGTKAPGTGGGVAVRASAALTSLDDDPGGRRRGGDEGEGLLPELYARPRVEDSKRMETRLELTRMSSVRRSRSLARFHVAIIATERSVIRVAALSQRRLRHDGAIAGKPEVGDPPPPPLVDRSFASMLRCSTIPRAFPS